MNALIAFEQSFGAVPLLRVVTVIVDVADNVLDINVPVVPLNTIVAVFPLVAGFVVLYVTVYVPSGNEVEVSVTVDVPLTQMEVALAAEVRA